MVKKVSFLMLTAFLYIFFNSCGDDGSTESYGNYTNISEETQKISTEIDNLKITDNPKIHKTNLEGSEILVEHKEYNQNTPKIIYLKDKDLWFVIWADERNLVTTGIDLYGMFIKPDGSLCSNEIQLTNNPENETNPTVTYNYNNDKIVFAWQDTRDPYIYLNSIDITNLNTTNCSGYNISAEQQIPYNTVYGENLISRSKPFIKYDNVNNRFLLTFLERRDSFPRVQCTLGNNPILTKDGLTNNYIGYAEISADLSTISSDIVRNDSNSDALLAREIVAKKTSLEEEHILEIFNDLDNPVIGVDTTSNTQIIIFEGKRGKITFTCTCDDANGDGVCQNTEDVTTNVSIKEINTGEITTQHIYGLYFSDFNKKYKYSYRIDKDLTAASFNPDIDFDPYSKRFLTVFENVTDSGNTKIYGQLINSGSSVYNNNILISYQDADEDGNQDDNVLNSKQSKPTVSFDSTNGRFFVAWEDSRNSSISSENLDLYGQYIDSEGSLRGKNYVITNKPFNQRYISLAFNPKNQQYLAVWQDARNAQDYTCGSNNNLPCGSDIYGQRFTLGQPQILLLREVIDQNGNTITVPLQPAIIDFGVVSLNDSKTISARIKNTGDTNLKIDCIQEIAGNSLVGNIFKILNIPPELENCNDNSYIELTPGTYTRLTLLFEPIEAKSYLTKLIIVSDAVQDKEINIIGIGSTYDTKIEVDKEAINFGSVVINQSEFESFAIINKGTKPVNINNITLTNADFTVKIGDITPTYPITLQPNTSIVLTIEFKPSSTGVKTGTITIDSDANDITIYTTGTGISENVALSTTQLDFGTQDVGGSALQSITITNKGQQDITLNNVSGLSAPFSIDNINGIPIGIINFPIMLKPSESATITVGFAPSTYGTFEQTLKIDTSEGVLSVDVKGTGLSVDLSVSPDKLDFGTLNVNDTKTLSFDIQNAGNKDAIVNSCSTTNPMFTITNCPKGTGIPSGSKTTINVEFKPTYIGSFTGKAIIKTDKGDISVDLIGSSAGLEADKLSINFGSVVVNQTKYQTFTLINKGVKTININNITLTNADFTVKIGDITPTYPITLQPNTSIVLTIEFKPSSTGVKTGTITIDSDANDITIYTTGTGVSENVALSTTQLDFGTQDVGGSALQSITITNKGQQDITINNVSGLSKPFAITKVNDYTISNFITGGLYNLSSILPITLKPSESATITVGFAPTAYGTFEQTLKIDTSEGVLSVDVKGTGLSVDLSVSPDKLDFGTLNVNDTKTLSFDIQNAGNKDAIVNSCSTTNPMFTITNCPANLAAGAKTTINVDFKPTYIGSFSGQAIIKTDKGDISVDLTGQSAGLEADKSLIDFGTVYLNNKKVAILKVKNNSNKTINITSIQKNVTDFEISTLKIPPIEVLPQSEVEVYITFEPTVEGFYTDTLEIKSDANNLKIYLQGRAIKPNISIVNPSNLAFGGTLNFGQVQVGTSKTIKVTLRNDSNSDIKLINIDKLIPGFTVNVNSFPLTLKAGETLDLLIEFNPTENKVYETTLNLLFDFSPTPYSIKLVGIGSNKTVISSLQIEDTNNNKINSLTFSKVFIGEIERKDIVIRNVSDKTVNIKKIELSNSVDFYLMGKVNNITLDKDGTVNITVYFSPTRIGIISSKLIIIDEFNNSYDISIEGIGSEFKVSTTKGKVEDFQTLATIPGITNKPSNFSPYKGYSFKVNTGDTNNPKTIDVLLTFTYLPDNPVFYKINKDGKWIKLENVSINGKNVSFEIKDNSELDLNDTIGIIEDPIIVGEEINTSTNQTSISQTPEIQTSGGGCTLSNKNDYSLLLMLLPLAIIILRRVAK